MILLKATTETLEIATSTTADIDYSISFADITTTTFNPSTAEGKITTATSTVILAAPAASTQRQVKLITITNRHASASNTVLVKKDISAVEYNLTAAITLLAGETLQYIDSQGWVRYAANGSIKGDLTAGGSTTQVQLNVDGTLSGDPDLTFDTSTKELGLTGANTSLLIQSISNEPTPPNPGLLRIYTKEVAGRLLPKWVGPAGIDTPFQPALFSNNVVTWTNTSATAGLWMGTVGAGAGTFNNTLPSFTNIYTSLRRARYANVVTTTNQILGQRGTEAMYFRGSIPSTGGFFFFCRFGFDAWTTGGRLFVGLSSNTTGAMIQANPSATVNTLGFGIDAGDTAITFMHNDGTGTATKETIAGQPALATNNGYDAWIYAKPNDSTVYFRLSNINTQSEIINSSVSIDLPISTTGLAPTALASNAALTTVSAIMLGVNRIYVETDF